ncbi:MAG: hypothetical protein C0453_01760 [Comamonadaceae bacterium]|nr:hypothetical protein [Comamonadaceae bacterium]
MNQQNTPFETITSALARALAGEPMPSFATVDFRELVSAVTAVSCDHFLHERIGREALSMLLGAALSSMRTERTLAVMRGNGEQP